MDKIIKVVIPAFNEEASIAKVVNDIPSFVNEIIVVSNNSTDNTEINAKNAGATVLKEPMRGYGKACLKGIDYILSNSVDIIVFLDGDYSDYPEEMDKVVEPILKGEIDMVIGSRALGQKTKGSMMPQQIFGNWLANLGPFRAITREAYEKLGMVDENYGWTVEMQVKAVKKKLKWTEVPVNYRVRIGDSKVSGTIKGTINAGYKIILTIFRYL
jgi:glycosyltransferase involved in cell wall biosynthesis